MANETILVVDDEQSILELVQYNLSQRGYRVLPAETGEGAIQTARREKPDLIVLDLMLPGIDGLDVCRFLKAEEDTKDIPILMLSARGEEDDVALGMEMGADDYILKPFSPKVLLARIRAALRRRQDTADEFASIIRVGPLVVNPKRYEASLGGEVLDLTLAEFKLLYLLAGRPGKVFTREEILQEGNSKGDVSARSVDVIIAGLRQKLGASYDCVETVRNAGYRLVNL
ncbi:MAG: response regulator transcription factor [Sedimentisphaerales bacterium]|nr:response regulator transcription factor [Sedimentisphaerales bacterium]